jgi:hypothetical protein
MEKGLSSEIGSQDILAWVARVRKGPSRCASYLYSFRAGREKFLSMREFNSKLHRKV